MKKRYHQLLRLAGLLFDLQEQQPVNHPYKDLLSERLQSRVHEELADLLIRQFTLLNRVHRIKEKGAYQSEEQDLLMALQIMLAELKSATLISPGLQASLVKLNNHLKTGMLFQRKDVQRITGYSKTQSWRLIQLLEQAEKIRRVAGSPNTGYYYEIIQQE